MKINVLGTEYTVEYRKKGDDPVLEDNDGYCDSSMKLIVVEDMKKEKGSKEDLEEYKNQVLRHEIIHAFLFESGLDGCALSYNGAWAKSEEMVDWLAIQSPKIAQVFKEAGCL